MRQGITLTVSAEDAAFLVDFKARTGLDATTIGQIGLAAILNHLREHHTLSLPLNLQPDCHTCPHFRAYREPENVLTFRQP